MCKENGGGLAKRLRLNISEELLLAKEKVENILTDREKECLGAVRTGITSSQEIASLLCLTPQVVKNHFTSIYKKLEIREGKKEEKKTLALVTAISLREIEPFKPSIDEENTPIFKRGLGR